MTDRSGRVKRGLRGPYGPPALTRGQAASRSTVPVPRGRDSGDSLVRRSSLRSSPQVPSLHVQSVRAQRVAVRGEVAHPESGAVAIAVPDCSHDAVKLGAVGGGPGDPGTLTHDGPVLDGGGCGHVPSL